MHDDRLNETPRRVDAVTLHNERKAEGYKPGWVHWRAHKWKIAQDLRNLARAQAVCPIVETCDRQLMLDAADALDAAPR